MIPGWASRGPVPDYRIVDTTSCDREIVEGISGRTSIYLVCRALNLADAAGAFPKPGRRWRS